jgi:uncharacterized membrane protein SirB2
MYMILYYTHKITVILFILIYLVKGFMLLTDRKDALENIRSAIRVPEIVISVLLLVSGIGLWINISEMRTLFILKLVAVFIAIPLAIIAFRRMNKALAVLVIILLIGSYGLAEMNKYSMVKRLELPKDIVTNVKADNYNALVHGRALYNGHCINCHGEDGKLGMSGANDLTRSVLNKKQVIYRINVGQYTMPGYADLFTEEEIEAVAEYAMSLRE